MPSTVRKTFMVAALPFFLIIRLFAQEGSAAEPPLPSIAQLLGEDVARELLAKGQVMRTSVDAKTSILPRHESTRGVSEEIAAKKPGILVETVFALRRKAPSDRAGREAELLKINALLRSFSSLRGVRYFSITNGGMRTLYVESYAVDGPDGKTRIPDPPAPDPRSLDEPQSFHVFQKDLSFGANVYTYAFQGFPGAVKVTSKNETWMNIAIIPVIAPGVLVSRLIVMQASDGIVFYVESDAISIGFLAQRIGESFANRATALFGWFESRFASASPQ